MQLTQFTDFSCRVLIYLARLPEPGSATISEIAEYHKISRNHLIKVVNNLAGHGFIETTRGKGGGLRLARAPHMISIGEVVRLTETNMNLVECFDLKSNQCRIIRGCGLKSALYEARRAFMTVLDKFTLADVAANSRPFPLTAPPPLYDLTESTS